MGEPASNELGPNVLRLPEVHVLLDGQGALVRSGLGHDAAQLALVRNGFLASSRHDRLRRVLFMSVASRRRSPILAFLLSTLFLAGCGGDGSPGDTGTNPNPDPDPDPDPDPLPSVECADGGFACTPADVDEAVMERTDQLLDGAAERLADGETTSAVAQWLESQDGMHVVLTSDHAVMFILEGGLPVTAYDATSATGIGAPEAAAAARKAADPAVQSGPPARVVVGEGTPRENPERQKRALVLSPFAWEYTVPDAGQGVASALGAIDDYAHAGGVTFHTDDAVGVAQFSAWDDYDVVVLNTHGGQLSATDSQTGQTVNTSFFVTGIEVPRCAELYMDPYRNLQGVSCAQVASRYENMLGNPADEYRSYITVLPNFFSSTYPGGLERAVVILNACRSFVSQALPSRLAGGSSAVFGWTNDVLAGFNSSVIPDLVSRLAQGLTTEEAFDETCSGPGCVDTAGKGAQLRRLGPSDDLRIRDIPRLVTPLPSSGAAPSGGAVTGTPAGAPRLASGSTIPYLGQAGDGEADDLLLMIEVDGVQPGDESDFTVRALVDGDAKGEWSLDSENADRISDNTMRLRETAALGFDVQDSQSVKIELEVDLPEGGMSKSELTVVLTNPKLEFGSTIRSVSTQGYEFRSEVEASIALTLRDNPVDERLEIDEGEGDLRYVSFEFLGGALPGGCTASTGTSDGTLYVLGGELVFDDPEASEFGVPENLEFGFDGLEDLMTITCPQGGNTSSPTHWVSTFVTFHSGYFGGGNEFSGPNGGWLVEDWTPGSGGAYAEKRYDRAETVEGAQFTEETTLEITGPEYPGGG